MAKSKPSKSHIVEQLEQQFHTLQKRISKARNDYIASHQSKISSARKRVKTVQAQLEKSRRKVLKAVAAVRKNSSKTARNQLKKARAASLLLGNSLKEARDILVTAESRLHSAKPFDRKLTARARVLEQFEKDWNKKMLAEAAVRTRQAKLAAARRRASAKQRAVKKGTAT